MCVAVSLHNGMLPGWCLYLSDSNLGPALPAGRTPALFRLTASAAWAREKLLHVGFPSGIIR